MKAVVLAAGEGVRLRPLTVTRPKHLIPVGGKPLLENTLLAVKSAGLDEAVIIVHYMAEKIKEHFGDGSKLGMKLEYVLQREVRGTADAVIPAEPYVSDDFLMLYGDLYVTTKVVKAVLKAHESEGNPAAMAVVPVKQPEHYGIIKLDGSRVTNIIEKPKPGEAPTNLANAGVYVLPTLIFEKIRQTPPSPRGEYEITDSLRFLAQEQPLVAVQISPEEWLDVGRPWDLLEANRRVLANAELKVNGYVEEGARLVGPVGVSAGARVRSGAYIEGPVFIGENSDIGPDCFIKPYTSIGEDVHIGNACKVENSIIMDKTKIGHACYIGDSIIGRECDFGAGTKTVNCSLDGETIKITVKNQIIDSERTRLGAIIGDGVKTGANVVFMPGIKAGPNSRINSNIVVHQDVPKDASLHLKQEIEKRKKD